MTDTRWAEAEDSPALEAFLLTHVERAMFPLSNLRRFGVSGAGGGYACRFLVTWAADQIVGVVAVDSGGAMLPVGAPDLSVLHREKAGTKVPGCLGAKSVARAVLDRLGLDSGTAVLDDDQPHFALELSQLVMPETSHLTLLPLAVLPRPLAIAWRAAHAQEVLGDTPEAATTRAMAEIETYVAENTHRVLYHGDQPVAMTGFNAELPEIVQVGAVFTPPELRSRGYARAAVALHLAEARARGVSRAVLFAASDPAVKAYKALGFHQIGHYSLILFADPPKVPPCP